MPAILEGQQNPVPSLQKRRVVTLQLAHLFLERHFLTTGSHDESTGMISSGCVRSVTSGAAQEGRKDEHGADPRSFVQLRRRRWKMTAEGWIALRKTAVSSLIGR